MDSEVFTLHNRKGEYMTALVEHHNDAVPTNGLVFIVHGLGGWKEQPLLRAAAEAFLNGLVE